MKFYTWKNSSTPFPFKITLKKTCIISKKLSRPVVYSEYQVIFTLLSWIKLKWNNFNITQFIINVKKSKLEAEYLSGFSGF